MFQTSHNSNCSCCCKRRNDDANRIRTESNGTKKRRGSLQFNEDTNECKKNKPMSDDDAFDNLSCTVNYSSGQLIASQHNERGKDISSHAENEEDLQDEDIKVKDDFIKHDSKFTKFLRFYPVEAAAVGFETDTVNTVNKFLGSTTRPIFIRSVIKMADKCTQLPDEHDDTSVDDPFPDCEEEIEQMMGAPTLSANNGSHNKLELNAELETNGGSQFTETESINPSIDTIPMETIDLTQDLNTDSEDTPPSDQNDVRQNSEKSLHSQKTLFDYGISVVKVKIESLERMPMGNSKNFFDNSAEVTVLQNEFCGSPILVKNDDLPITTSEVQPAEILKVTWEYLRSHWSEKNTVYMVIRARNVNLNPLSLKCLVDFSKRHCVNSGDPKFADKLHITAAFNSLMRLKMYGAVNLTFANGNIENISLSKYAVKIFNELKMEDLHRRLETF